MTLASFTDANAHLDEDKVKFANMADAEPEATSVDRYVRGRLTAVFDGVELWDYDPTGSEVATPVLIREIAGMLMAAQRYENKYSLEADTGDNHASRKRAQAENLLNMLVMGDITLEEVGVVSGVIFSINDFYPDGIPVEGVTDPKFTMNDVF